MPGVAAVHRLSGEACVQSAAMAPHSPAPHTPTHVTSLSPKACELAIPDQGRSLGLGVGVLPRTAPVSAGLRVT